MSRRGRLRPYNFGPLPTAAINHALSLELEPAPVVMSVRAQQHAQRRHPADFARTFPHVASVIATPLYVRDDFINEGKIELVGRPANLPEYLLVAVELERDANGNYNVVSFYPISQVKVQRRREGGHLVRLLLM